MLRSIKYGVNGAVLAGLVAAPVLWTAVDKSVDLVVDGQGRTVTTTASEVGQVLTAHGYHVNSHDIVAPGVHSAVHDGSRIVLRRGRLLDLNINGRREQVWTTAPTVSQALGELGYTTSDFVSVSRAQRLPLSATDIAIRTPKQVSVLHDGKTEQLTTTDGTVGQVLADLGITVAKDDRLSVPASSVLTSDEQIQVQRVTTKTVTHQQKIKYSTTKKKYPALPKGSSEVLTNGQDGLASVTYSLVYVDGKLIGKTQVASRTLQAPQNQVLAVGTGSSSSRTELAADSASTPNAPAPDPGSAQAIAKQLLAARGWGDDQFSCLVQMWNRESGWNTHAANPSGAYGIPQALPGSKMSSAGPDWQDNATTQITWGIGYIAARYGTPCGAWSFWQAHDYY